MYPQAGTGLTAFVSNGNLEMAAKALDKGKSSSSIDQSGVPMLQRACINGHTEMAKMLIERGADVTAGSTHSRTALHEAAQTGAQGEDCVKLLLEHEAVRANLECMDSNGDTPLLLACKRGTPTTLTLLLDAGANPNFLDAGDFSPLMRCREGSDPERTRVLEKYGGQPHKRWNAATKKWEKVEQQVQGKSNGATGAN